MTQMPEEKESGLAPKTIAVGVIVVLAVVFILQNTAKGDIDFLFWTLSMPAWIWLLVMFGAGVIAGSLFPWLRPRKKD